METAIPTAHQLEYQDWEFGIFLHFGIRTFHEGHRDWDGKPMDPANFNPSEFSCEEWVTTAKRAGAKYMVLTAKHHDGFANWPSKYTDFSVESTPWRDGKGDVVREFAEACRNHDMKMGLYYSPADASMKKYDDETEYDDYFINQISEILTGYGKLDILWFDGCGSEGHEYDWARIVKEIRRMQPEVLIFSMGDPDFRWVGNECGVAPVPTWNTVDAVPFSIQTDEQVKVGEGQVKWLPAECDCRMRDVNWFYSDEDEHTVKTLEELMGLYYYSVGRGANLLLNIGPDRRGLLPDADAERLIQFGAEVRRRFGNPVATIADCTREGDTWAWSPAQPTCIDHVVLQEDLTEGEHVRRFEVKVAPFPHGKGITVWEGQNVGHKAICQFPMVKATNLTVEITDAEGAVSMREIHITSSVAD